MILLGEDGDGYDDEDDREDMKEPRAQIVKQMTLTLGVPKVIKVDPNDTIEEFDLDGESGRNIRKNNIIVLLEEDDLKVFTYLRNRYIAHYMPKDDEKFEEVEEAENESKNLFSKDLVHRELF